MLKQRILTALVLLACLLPALIVQTSWPFAVLMAGAMAAAGWEWARLNGAGRLGVGLGIGLGVACGLALWAGWTARAPREIWWAAAAIWVLGGAWALRAGVAGWPRVPQAVRLSIGLVALWTTWLAMAHAKTGGLNYVLSIFMLVWAADVFAYFGGRAFGRRKLAPSISPGKSWAGVWSGMAGAVVLAIAWIAFDGSGLAYNDSFYTIAETRWTGIGVVPIVVFLVAMSVVGDLFESLVKRSAGAKDSSALLPGHGGILDRIDALLPVFPIALALAPP